MLTGKQQQIKKIFFLYTIYLHRLSVRSDISETLDLS
jgi:hypothetical protein